jgi:CheY-like chemotaxis protein
MRILVIEDHEEAAVLLQRLLQADGHEVSVATTARAGIAAVDAGAPALVLCDLGLPGELDGLEVGRVLQGRQRRPYLVALTGYSSEDHRRAAIEAGFDRLLAKPVRHSELARVCADAAAAISAGDDHSHTS